MVPHTVFLSPLFGMADKTSVKLIVHQLSIDNFCLPFFFLSNTQCDQINSCQNFC